MPAAWRTVFSYCTVLRAMGGGATMSAGGADLRSAPLPSQWPMERTSDGAGRHVQQRRRRHGHPRLATTHLASSTSMGRPPM